MTTADVTTADGSPAPRAVIFGLEGLEPGDAEVRLFAEADPLGFILFARNIDDPPQVQRLCATLRDIVGRPDALVLIDQEGGRVRRLLPPQWRNAPPAEPFGALFARDQQRARDAVRLNHRLIAAELAELGITVDCAPVLDVRCPGAHEIIGDRAFSTDPRVVAELGRAACEGLLAGGVLPIVKHIPGHGRAGADSHVALPVVHASASELDASDFLPFRRLADMPLAMTAHVVYAACDAGAPATTSATLIERVIRGTIGFDGLLISDDLCMQALHGRPGERARAAIAAGCDVLLHCNGNLAEMVEIADAAPPLSPAGQARLARGRAMLPTPEPIDAPAAERRLAALLHLPAALA